MLSAYLQAAVTAKNPVTTMYVKNRHNRDGRIKKLLLIVILGHVQKAKERRILNFLHYYV